MGVSDTSAKPLGMGMFARRTGLDGFLVRLWKTKPLGAACGIVVLVLVLVAIFADVLAPFPYFQVHPLDTLQASSTRYLLGTDQLGRDFLSRILYGARLSIAVGLSATALNVVVAVLIGGISGFLGRKFDLVVQRFVDAWMAFPGLLILLTVMSLVGRGVPQIMSTFRPRRRLAVQRGRRSFVMCCRILRPP